MRKLATFAAVFSATIFFGHYFVPGSLLLTSVAVCCVLGLTALVFIGNFKKRVVLLTLALSAGFLFPALTYYTKTLPAEALDGQELRVQAKLTEYPKTKDDYSLLTVRLTGENVPHLKAIVYSTARQSGELSPGDLISFNAYIKKASERYGKPWDGYTADNIYLICYADDEITYEGRSTAAFLYFPHMVAKNVNETVMLNFSEETAPFITALITGEKTELYEDSELYTDLAQAGILHIVAVSGTHISFIIGFLWLVIRRNKTASLIGIPLIWFFAIMTGASASVLRAALMQTLVLAAPLVNRENDSITSISAALMILFMINPNACASVALQLSFTAMLGIIVISPRVNRFFIYRLRPAQERKGLHKIIYRAVYALIAAFSSSLGALFFSTPVMALQFGYFSLYSIIVNMLIFWAVSIVFLFAYISVILAVIWLPFGSITSVIANLLTAFIISVARFTSDLPYAVLYTDRNIFTWWIIFVYLVFAAFYILAIKRKRELRPVIPTVLSICILCTIIIYTELRSLDSDAKMTVLDVGQGQCIVLTKGDVSFVVDCGGKGILKNPGQTAAASLFASGHRDIDLLALTHFDEDHVNGVIDLMCRIKVNCLLIPDENSERREEIVNFADKHGTEVYIINNNSDDIEFSASGLSLTSFSQLSRIENELVFLASAGDCVILITGDAYEEAEKRFLMRYEMPDTDIYVAGHHGSKHSSSAEFLEATKAETAVISCGYNSYGHPADETIKRFNALGMRILRTDQDGSITIELEE